MEVRKERVVAYFLGVILLVIGIVSYAAFPERPPEEPVRISMKSSAGKVLFDMKNDMSDLKQLVFELMEKDQGDIKISESKEQLIQKLYNSVETKSSEMTSRLEPTEDITTNIQDTEEIVEESLSLVDKEIELIKKALEKHHGKRKHAANELGISERTLYRKIKEYDIE